ncbi:MAG: hypothetical protein IMZ50_06115 [Candidatus Atribacteria bacterium]|nr:hypothetical protein [Candidatus Atribacteria bacterium]
MAQKHHGTGKGGRWVIRFADGSFARDGRGRLQTWGEKWAAEQTAKVMRPELGPVVVTG